MNISNLKPNPGSKRKKSRKGRGPGSHLGKTCGRGQDGAGSRTNPSISVGYEGGQMPTSRRLPKRGFNNKRYETYYEIVNVSQLERFDDGAVIGVEQLSQAGLINARKGKVKILGDGELTKKLQITAHKFSKSAEQKIAASGGTAKVI